MRIAHVTATFPPYAGGTGNVVAHNARALARLGHRVTIYTARVRGRSWHDGDGLDVRRLPALIRFGNAPLLPGLLLLGRHDLVHLHYPFIFGAELVLALKRLKDQPYVVTYHNDLLAPGVKGSLFRIYERIWARRLMQAARRVIVTSWDGAAGSHILGPMIRSDPDRFREIPNGVDISLFSQQDGAQMRARLNLDGPVILFVGSMDSAHHPKGGVPVLLKAVAALRNLNVTVLLAGDGDRVGEYRALAARHGLAGRTRFLGRVAHQDLPPLYAAADLVVQPSQLFEPFGLVAIEAMACGRPVIASDLPGVRRVVSEAGGGLLARPGDPEDVAAKIRLLISNPATRRRLGAAGRSGVETRYDWQTIGPMLEKTYQEALASP